MKKSKSIVVTLCIGFVAVCGTAAADGLKGKIKMCRLAVPGASTAAVYVPADGTWSAACPLEGDCRDIVIGITAASTLKGAAGACATLDAVLVKEDGQPINAGDTLIPQWHTGSLVSRTTVVKAFE